MGLAKGRDPEQMPKRIRHAIKVQKTMLRVKPPARFNFAAFFYCEYSMLFRFRFLAHKKCLEIRARPGKRGAGGSPRDAGAYSPGNIELLDDDHSIHSMFC